jgi:minor extracellular serine protease Vpr
MRFRLPPGRTALIAAALACAFAVPAAIGASAAPSKQVPVSTPAPAPTATGSGQSSEIFLVQLEDSADTFRQQAKAVGLKYTQRFEYDRLFDGLSVRISPDDVGKLAGIGSVGSITPARYFTLGPEPAADPDLATAIQMTGADLAQAAGWSGEGVKVAVMDTGIDVDHPDLGGDGNQAAPQSFPNSRIVAGFDLVGNDYNADPESATYQPVPHPDAVPDDCNGHGTHVAGIVGADKASGAGGALGVAPDVTFGAYRVFGCDGSTTDDIMIAAMERALADGMHVLNMSIGDAFNNWAGSPTAAASDALVEAGMVVVASIGNSGANGIYSAGAPGVGNKVIGVASYDNTFVQSPGFTITPDNRAIPYTDSVAAPPAPEPPPPPTSGTVELKQTTEAAAVGLVPPNTFPGGTAFPDGCAAFPAGFFAGKAALIRRGSCTFSVKAQNAQAAGAVAVVLYNNQGGGVTPQAAANIPVVMINQADGLLIHNRLLGGPVSLTWQTQVLAANPTGGLISAFSSYGTEATLATKPDLGAPGGFIRSAYPLEKGGFATISGTSMASPHVAGAVALLKEARPGLAAERFRDVLQNSADPAVWSGNPGLGLLDIVHRQGAGMVDIDDSIASRTTITPGKLSLGEGSGGSVTLTLSNTSGSPVTYELGHEVAISTGPQTFGPLVSDFWLPNTQVAFGAPGVTVPAGGTATVTATITADPLEPTPPLFEGFPTRGLYGGYIQFIDPGDDSVVFSVPYTGFKGDYQSIVALPNAPLIGKQNTPFTAGPQTYTPAAANEVWTLQTPDEVPNLLLHFGHQVRHLELQVVNAATGAPVHPVFANYLERDFLARNALQPGANGPYNTQTITAFPWDGTRMHDNGRGTPDHRKVVPNGSYKIVVKALKAGGDPGNAAHWETLTSPTITIARP